jgi:hypothetical protein
MKDVQDACHFAEVADARYLCNVIQAATCCGVIIVIVVIMLCNVHVVENVRYVERS